MTETPERVLITGGSGFLGACLARALIADNAEVHLIVRPESNRWRLVGVESACKLHWTDLRDTGAVRRAVVACRPEVIYHLAAHGAYPFQQDRAAILASNLMGTANLLDALEGHDFQRLVHVGSSSEYGHTVEPMREVDRLDPRTDYAAAKAGAALLCQAEAHKRRPVAIVRVFSAYGPSEDPSRLVPYVMGCCCRGEQPHVSAGTQPRDFIYTDDVVALIRLAAHHPAALRQVRHAGSGRQARVREMVETILSVCGEGRMTAQYSAASPRGRTGKLGVQYRTHNCAYRLDATPHIAERHRANVELV